MIGTNYMAIVLSAYDAGNGSLLWLQMMLAIVFDAGSANDSGNGWLLYERMVIVKINCWQIACVSLK